MTVTSFPSSVLSERWPVSWSVNDHERGQPSLIGDLPIAEVASSSMSTFV
jgi:hypothetical protein